MFGKLFGKKHADEANLTIQEKLSSPKDILQPIGQSLVINHKLEPDWVWNLKTVTRSYTNDLNHVEFRVYDVHETSGRGVVVKNYNSLEDHQDLILYSGWMDKKTKYLELVDHREVREKAV